MWSPAGGHKGRPYKGLSPPSAFRKLMPTSARPATVSARPSTPLLYLLSCHASGSGLSCRRKPEKQVRAGSSISPAPTSLLETANQGARPPIGCAEGREGIPARPGRRGRCQAPAAGKPPRQLWETPRRGIAIPPSCRFRMGVGKGNRNPLSNWLFAPFGRSERARRRPDDKSRCQKGFHEGAPASSIRRADVGRR